MVCNNERIRTQSDLLTVEQYEFFALFSHSNPNTAFDLGKIEGMQGLTQFEHYVVGYIDDGINAPDIGAAQTLNHPKRRRARQINITDNTPEITRACLGSQDLDWTCVVMMQRRHGELHRTDQ